DNASFDASLSPGHQPVMLAEAIDLLAVRPGGRYVDATFGGGGHTRAILEASAPDGQVLALDADPAAVARGEALVAEFAPRLTVRHANFAGMTRVARAAGFAPVDGVLMDLGFSSFQIDEPARGFSFQRPG